jgi:hypothetical protein
MFMDLPQGRFDNPLDRPGGNAFMPGNTALHRRTALPRKFPGRAVLLRGTALLSLPPGETGTVVAYQQPDVTEVPGDRTGFIHRFRLVQY